MKEEGVSTFVNSFHRLRTTLKATYSLNTLAQLYLGFGFECCAVRRA